MIPYIGTESCNDRQFDTISKSYLQHLQSHHNHTAILRYNFALNFKLWEAKMQEFCGKKRFVVGITGASGIRLGIRFARHLARFAKNSEIFVIFSNGAKMVSQYEDKIADIFSDSHLNNLLDSHELHKDSRKISRKSTAKITILNDSDLDSPVSSGSFGVSATLIIPCSANTLAKIACGISETLITRAALVALKEHKTLLLAPREMPLNAIMLQNMLVLSQMGAIIAPPMLSYYAGSENLAEMEDFMCGKWLDSIGVEHNLFPRWGESSFDKRESNFNKRESASNKRKSRNQKGQ